jgi:class 3 adenylate cyclase
MPGPSFRAKLLLAMLLVVTLVTGSTVVVLQQHVEATYRHIFEERFQDELDLFAAGQEARLAAVRAKGLELARSVRLIAAMEEEDAALLYRIALDELRDVLRPPPDTPHARPAVFFRFVSAHGDVLPTSDARAGLLDAPDRARWERQLARAGSATSDPEVQQVGYLAPTVGQQPRLHELILTQIIDPVRHEGLGALAIGFAADDLDGSALAEPAQVKSGVWLEGRLYTRAIPGAVAPALATAVAAPGASRGDLALTVDGVPHRLFFRVLDPESRLPTAYQVGLYSMAESLARQRALRRRVLAAGGAGLGLAFLLSLLLARGLSVPIRELAAAAGRIRQGELEARVSVRSGDELGRLATSFNEMAEGLALKEKYRSVLELVSDKDVAQELMTGTVALGGELRQVTVLFCDIRGFTPRTQGMDPVAVIRMLNEHMTALTRAVHAHGGVVDKFVGDALVALFGAPKSTGDDARNAIGAARQMIAERERLNASTHDPLTVGVGIASGTVVAGCMGSEDRLNYTVLGERVNLAARLCAHADGMEVLLDDATRASLAETVRTEPLPGLQLKGFGAPVAAYRLVSVAATRAVS